MHGSQFRLMAEYMDRRLKDDRRYKLKLCTDIKIANT